MIGKTFSSNLNENVRVIVTFQGRYAFVVICHPEEKNIGTCVLVEGDSQSGEYQKASCIFGMQRREVVELLELLGTELFSKICLNPDFSDFFPISSMIFWFGGSVALMSQNTDSCGLFVGSLMKSVGSLQWEPFENITDLK